MCKRVIYKVSLFFYIVIAICTPFESFPQQLRWQFKNFTTNDGLPSSEVHQVLSDSRNFIWFATDHGACRYDGYRFETFNLPDNSILSIYEDLKKRIWFVTFSGKLFYYEKEKMNSYIYNDKLLKTLEQAVVNKVYVDSADNVYVSTLDPGSFKISAKGEILQFFTASRQNVIENFETDNGDYFTHVTGNPSTNKIVFFHNLPIFSSIIIKKRTGNIKIEFPDYLKDRKSGVKLLSNNNLIFFSNKYFFKISPKGDYVVKKTVNTILDVEELDKGTILVATLANGLYLLDQDNEVIANYFPGLTVTSIERDYEGGLWFSTTQEGVFYLNSLQMKHLAHGENIINEKITCLAVDKDSTVLAGMATSEFLFFKPEMYFNHVYLPVNHILNINMGLQPEAIFLSVGTLINQEPYQVYFGRYNGKKLIAVQTISELIKKNEEIFTGNVTGINKVNFKTKLLEIQHLNAFRVSKLFLDSNENMLVGNLFGLWYYRNGELYPYDSTKEVLRSRITDINNYKKQYLCLATRGKGFLIYLGDTLHQITTANGLAGDNIRKIFVDESFIWLATNQGISRLAVLSLDPFKYKITNISVQDGLPSNEVNDIKKLDSNIIAATNSGISFFHQDLFSGQKNLSLSFYLTGVRINGIDTVISESYKLNYRKRNLYLSFVALSYQESSAIEYRYRMAGIDSNWAYTTSREIQLNPLPYGRFTIQVQARRRDENWISSNSLYIYMNCIPPFWRTIWFWVSSFLVTAYLMLLFFINRTNKIKQREKEKTLVNKKLAEMEMKALRAQMNPHFIFNVLSSIQYYITHNDNEKAQYYLSKFAKLVRMTLDNSRTTFISLADELLLLHLYIDLELFRFEEKFSYEINVDESIITASVKIPNMLLQPYVENSIKHGFRIKNQQYFLKVHIIKKDGSIVCIIEDNGIGRDKASLYAGAEKERHASTGTIIIREKMDALKQYYNYDISSETIDLKDMTGNIAGTRVTLIFPEKIDIP